MVRAAWPLVLALSLPACRPVDDLLVVEQSHVVTAADGTARVQVEALDWDRSFLLAARANSDEDSAAAYVAVLSVQSPGGRKVLRAEDWWDQPRSLTLAVWAMAPYTVLNWPIRRSDHPLEAGTWTVELAAVDSWTGWGVDGVRIDLRTTLLEEGREPAHVLRARLFWASGVREVEGYREAVQGAVERWREIYADAGIELETSFEQVELDPELPDTARGDPSYEELAGRLESGELAVLLGRTIEGDWNILGESGGIPGALSPLPNALVGIALDPHAGSDGAFQDAEVSLLGSTMAHEVGHYLGLFHPVESDWAHWDALDDTPECSSQDECDELFASNLMYWTPVCTFFSCIPQEELTADQRGVMKRYTGVY